MKIESQLVVILVILITVLSFLTSAISADILGKLKANYEDKIIPDKNMYRISLILYILNSLTICVALILMSVIVYINATP